MSKSNYVKPKFYELTEEEMQVNGGTGFPVVVAVAVAVLLVAGVYTVAGAATIVTAGAAVNVGVGYNATVSTVTWA